MAVGKEGEMAPDTTHGLLEIEQIGDVTVGRFTRRTILETTMINAVVEHLRQLVRSRPCQKVALNFSRVESITSAMLGALVSLHNEVESSQGRLVFCCVQPFLAQIFQVCKIPEQIKILPGEEEAIRGLA
jgi:anti-anti-sigma factor